MEIDAAVRPRLKSSVRPIIDLDEGLFLLFEGRTAWLRAPIYLALAPLLDGTHDVESIFETLSRIYSIDQVVSALVHLRKRGYLSDDVSAEADAAPEEQPATAFWEHVGVAPSLARSRLARARVSTIAVGEVSTKYLTNLLEDDGITLVGEGDFMVVATDDYLRPELVTLNARALVAGKAWLLVKPVGTETWIGPLFVPGHTACWECLAQRLRGHRTIEQYIAQRSGTDAPVGVIPACIPSARHAALAEAVKEVTCWIVTAGQSSLHDHVMSTNVLTMERTYHTLTRRPQCTSCGSPRANNSLTPKPVLLRPCRKLRNPDGEHRALSDQDVLRQLERHVSPITGIVGTVTPGERTGKAGGSSLTPTFAADHGHFHISDARLLLRDTSRRLSGGKGKSDKQARISAIAESLERYCGVFDGTEPRIRASFANLRETALHPNSCMLYSEQQYAQRESYNQKPHRAHWVPQPFQEDAAIEWTPLWSLTAQQPRYLPTSFCYYDYRSPDPLFARADSNGCAAGSVFEDAVLHGLLELIERDSVALWWYNRVRRRPVDLHSVNDPYVSALIHRYTELRREVWVLDVTSDLGVATFAAISRRVDKIEEDIIYGFGAHLDPGVALVRALTELNQSLEAVPTATGPESMSTYRGGQDAVHWWRTVRVADATYLAPDLEAGSCRLSDFRNLATDDLYEDITTCQLLAAAKSVEILVLDQTRPDIGLPVVRVVAPGLRHFWPRFGPGRLYEVPIHEGWLSLPLKENELNPYPVQF